MTFLPCITAAAVAWAQVSDTTIDRVLRDGIDAGVFPGAVVVVGTAEHVLYANGVGRFTWSASSATPDPAATLFDLASLTKVVATTPAVMVLVERGLLDLDRAVQDYLPDFAGPGKKRVTVRHLLQHRSGLRAFLPLNERADDAGEARTLVMEEPLRWQVGTRTEYSDLNAMLLGWVVESVAGRSLDRCAGEWVFGPAGMDETRFRPPAALRPRIAPVGLWRGHAIAGELHDQNAVRLGGVSGHAGLYSTGLDLARFAQVMLRDGALRDGGRLFRPGTIEHFTDRGEGNRALGWEMRDTTSVDNHGRLLSESAYGHTGYTGTSLWIDPERGLFVVVLTNRVFSPRARASISRLKGIRGAVADAAVSLLERWCTANAGVNETACR
jgi:CubicO group peptidase (beta-lactamase class C family)